MAVEDANAEILKGNISSEVMVAGRERAGQPLMTRNYVDRNGRGNGGPPQSALHFVFLFLFLFFSR